MQETQAKGEHVCDLVEKRVSHKVHREGPCVWKDVPWRVTDVCGKEPCVLYTFIGVHVCRGWSHT